MSDCGVRRDSGKTVAATALQGDIQKKQGGREELSGHRERDGHLAKNGGGSDEQSTENYPIGSGKIFITCNHLIRIIC